jgi:hypothetical protein
MDTLDRVRLKLLVAHNQKRFDLAAMQMVQSLVIILTPHNPKSNKFRLNFAVLAGSSKV